MEGDFFEAELYEAVLPQLRVLFGREPADRYATDAAARVYVEKVERGIRQRSEVRLEEPELIPVLDSVYEGVLHLVGLWTESVPSWQSGHIALAEQLMDLLYWPALDPHQEQEMRRLLRVVCRLVLHFVRDADLPDTGFEDGYREHVAAAYGRTVVYGAPGREQYEVPLYVTYVLPELRVRSPDFGPVIQPLKEAVAAHPRLLVRGTAGVGKTTALHWVAAQAASGGQPALPDGDAPVPFYLPVRMLARRDRLPGPGELLSALDYLPAPPPDWERRILTQGRGLLLVDGVDEIPAGERERVRRWLTELCAAFPRNRWLITCRPAAVPEEWLVDLGFAEADVAPFSAVAAEDFVRRWYQAKRPTTAPPGEAEERAEALLALLRERPDLALLTTTPLMCGFLCALHDERRGFLPRSRAVLYSAMLAMLLDRRDVERGIHLHDGDRLSAEEQLALLGDLAYWMVRNGYVEAPYEQALHVIATSRASMPQVPVPEETLTYFLTRSGVLRSPVEGAVDFVHRSFQDFLAARSLVENGDFGLLVEHVGDDQWRDVFLCAVGLASVRERSSLLELVLERGDAAQQRSEALHFHLLAAAGLAEANALDPHVFEAVKDRIAGHLPPRTPEEEAAFARLGPTLLGLLPDPDQVPPDETGAFLEILGRIPGPEAGAVARRFATWPDRTPLPAVVRALPEPAPGARQLAVALSIATRIEPELIRAVRLRVFPLLDAGDEADLWFSPWTAAQTPQAMALRAELLPVLRAELAERLASSAPDDPIWQVGRLVERVHAHISPALRVEERLNWLDVTGTLSAEGGSATADALLLPALRALVEEQREGIADWWAGAWPRLPEAVRESTGAWQLVTAALHRVPDVGLEQRPAPPGVTADDVAVIVDAVGDAVLTVSRSGGSLMLGAGAATAQDTAILVPDTHPRVVEVLDDAGSVFRTVTIPPGEERSVRVGAGPVRLRTPRGDIYELGAVAAAAGVSDVGALEGRDEPDIGGPRERSSGNGVYFYRTSAGALAMTVPEVASDVWHAEALKYSEEPPHPTRLSELRSMYGALAEALVDAGLEDVEVLLGELGGPADDPTDVTLAGHDPETGDPMYLCLELRHWSQLSVDPYEARLVRIGGHSIWVHPLERAHARRAYLCSTNAALRESPLNVDVAAYVHEATGDGLTAAGDDRLFLGDGRARLASFLRSRLAPRPGADAADLLLSGERLPLPGVLEAASADMPSPLLHPLDQQMLAVGRAMAAVHRQGKQVIVVTGAAGTGKTALALRLVREVRQLGAHAVCVSGAPAFRQSLQIALRDTRRKKRDRVVVPPEHFAGTATEAAPGEKPALLVFDDGQSLRSTSNGRYIPRTDRSQLDELLDAADVSVFLLDEGSRLRPTEVGTVDLIRAAAEARRLPVDLVALRHPIRFGGGAAYPRWVSALLAPDEDAVPWIPDDRHIVLTADTPDELGTFLRQRREEGFTARMTAGICWTLPSSQDAEAAGVRVGEWQRPWQSPTHGPEPDEVVTPYGMQGYEFDWCGVILGPDFVHRDGHWTTDREANLDPGLRPRQVANEEVDRLIRNAYRVLLTRGTTGVALFSTDPETQEALRRLVPGRLSDYR